MKSHDDTICQEVATYGSNESLVNFLLRTSIYNKLVRLVMNIIMKLMTLIMCHWSNYLLPHSLQ